MVFAVLKLTKHSLSANLKQTNIHINWEWKAMEKPDMD